MLLVNNTFLFVSLSFTIFILSLVYTLHSDLVFIKNIIIFKNKKYSYIFIIKTIIM